MEEGSDLMKTILRNNRGIALVVVIAMMVILLSITGASLLFSGLNLKTASNLKTGDGAIHTADAGIQHAMAIIPQGTSFTYAANTNTPVVAATAFPNANSGYSYSVTATNNPSSSSSSSTAILTSTATGPNGSKRVVRAYIGRSATSWAPPGAIYIPGPSSDPDFQIHGSATITGNDYNVDGTSGPSAALPGIATNDNTTTQQVQNSISTPANVTGAGGTTPNVATTTSPLDINALANSFLAQPHTSTCSGTTFGTWAAPQITYCQGEMEIKDGTKSGAGVLIVDGRLRIEDTFNFKGIIITRGGEVRIEASGSSTIYGATLISPTSPEIEIEGSGAIKYSSEAINKVNSTWPGVLPQKTKIIAWQEVMQ